MALSLLTRQDLKEKKREVEEADRGREGVAGERQRKETDRQTDRQTGSDTDADTQLDRQR